MRETKGIEIETFIGDLINSRMKEAKGIEIEDAEEIQVDNHSFSVNFIKELRDRTKELKRLNKEYDEGKVDV